MPQILKDLVFNLQSYIHWNNEYKTEQEYSALSNAVNFYKRLEELLPEALKIVRNDSFDDNCG